MVSNVIELGPTIENLITDAFYQTGIDVSSSHKLVGSENEPVLSAAATSINAIRLHFA